MQTETLNIEGMMCNACAGHVTRALEGLGGVQSARVSLKDKQATVTYDPAKAPVETLLEAVAEEGYTATRQG